MAKTTQQWWEEVSTNEERFNDWLKNQYHGERTAADRIQDLISIVPQGTDSENNKWSWRHKILRGILVDEVRHSFWIGELLTARGITPEILVKDERYWKETLSTWEGKSFEQLCAIGHLAEAMRLDRIKLLAADSRFQDVAEVFTKILPDEEFHTALFGILSTPAAIEEARVNHVAGMNAMGLLP